MFIPPIGVGLVALSVVVAAVESLLLGDAIVDAVAFHAPVFLVACRIFMFAVYPVRCVVPVAYGAVHLLRWNPHFVDVAISTASVRLLPTAFATRVTLPARIAFTASTAFAFRIALPAFATIFAASVAFSFGVAFAAFPIAFATLASAVASALGLSVAIGGVLFVATLAVGW
jgi:hypothetical protein